jgi:3-oxoadipate enol-lactonase
MALDALALLDVLQVPVAHVAGLSIGGLVAQSLAAQSPERVRSLVLCDTAMAIPPPETWHNRAATARREGMGPLIEAVVSRWVTEPFLQTVEAAGLRTMLRRTDPEGYAGAAEAIAACDLAGTTRNIKLPTLVIVGDQDAATPPDAAKAMRDAIAGAELVVLPGLAHIPTVQGPDAVTGAMRPFVQKVAGTAAQG